MPSIMPFFMMMDPWYWLILGIGFVLSAAASGFVKLRYRRASQVPIASGMTGAQVAATMLQDAGIDDVQITEHQGFLSDHYDPTRKLLALSPEVHRGRSAAAAGIAAHECGHAIQHQVGYAPMKLRSTLVPVAGVGSNLGIWLVIIGLFLGAGQNTGFGHGLAVVGVFLFAGATLFSLVTVPVEFDASSRAKRRLDESGILRYGEERDAMRGVLTAAGMTYVAAAATSVLMLLYWVMRLGLFGGRD